MPDSQEYPNGHEPVCGDITFSGDDVGGDDSVGDDVVCDVVTQLFTYTCHPPLDVTLTLQLLEVAGSQLRKLHRCPDAW